MSYSQRTTINDGRRQRRPFLLWLFGVAIGVCVLGLIGYRLFPGIYAWITRTGQYADIVTIKVTNTGFEPRFVTLSANQHLHIVNVSSYPVVICTGSMQVCNKNASANIIPVIGLTILPGKTYDLSLKNGNYGFTIMDHGALLFASTDLAVVVHATDNDSVESSNDYGVSSGGDSGGSSVSSGGDSGGGSVSSGGSSSSDDEEEDSGSSGSAGGGGDDGGDGGDGDGD